MDTVKIYNSKTYILKECINGVTEKGMKDNG